MRILALITLILAGWVTSQQLQAQEQSGLSFIQALNIDALTPLSRNEILPMKARAEKINAMLEDKLNSTLPQLMSREGIDMWILISREYNEDPIFLDPRNKKLGGRLVINLEKLFVMEF